MLGHECMYQKSNSTFCFTPDANVIFCGIKYQLGWIMNCFTRLILFFSISNSLMNAIDISKVVELYDFDFDI